MTSRNLILIFLLASFLACQSNENTEKKVLSPKEMAKVLTEIHLAESQIPHLSQFPDSAKKIYEKFERKVFEKTGIDSALYYQSYQYYINQVEEFEKIYTIVIDSLVYRESRMDIGKPMDSSQIQKTPLKPHSIDSSGLELKKRIKKLKKKDIITQS